MDDLTSDEMLTLGALSVLFDSLQGDHSAVTPLVATLIDSIELRKTRAMLTQLTPFNTMIKALKIARATAGTKGGG